MMSLIPARGGVDMENIALLWVHLHKT